MPSRLLTGMLAAALAVAASFASAAGPLRIVATTGMVGDAVRAIAGERAEVEVLIGAGVDPHLFKATRSDVAKLLNADAVFYSGLFLEGRLGETLERVAASGKPVQALTETIDEALLMEPEIYQGAYDPHVWMDPARWSAIIDVIRNALTALDPDGAAGFAARAEAYRVELARLDAYAEKALGAVPAERRVLVTAHDAFGYFGDRYGFEVMGIQGLSTESQAGLARIEELVNVLVERQIPAVFVESTIPARAVEALVEGAARRGHTVVIGGELFSDAMGAPGTYEGTYPGMIDHNVTVIARALGGDAPEKGLNGRLALAD